jgi:hypothetical protein
VLDIAKFLDTSQNPKGLPYAKTPIPPRRRNLPRARSARAQPAAAPTAVDLSAIATPRARPRTG